MTSFEENIREKVLHPFEHVVENEQKKSCRQLSFSCWIALITCFVIICQSIFDLVKHLSDNDMFWNATSKMMNVIQAYSNQSDLQIN